MRGWQIILLVLTGGVYVAMSGVHLFWIGPLFGESAAPDLRVTGYGADQIARWLDEIGVRGRRGYFDVFRRLDAVFPLLLALSLWTVYRALDQSSGGRFRSVLFGLLVGLYLGADLWENMLLAQLREDASAVLLVLRANLLTQIKFLAVFGALVFVGFALLRRR